MKKTRILSFLLAAIMTASSVPFVAPITVSAAAATETVTVSENLLDGITPTGNIETRQRDAGSIGNGYLHVGARADRWYGLGYNFNTTFEVGETYFLSFDLRASAATFNRQSKAWPMGREDIRVYGNVKQTNGKYNSGNNKTDYTYWDISRLTKNELGATYKDRILYIANDYKSSATEYKFYTKNWDVLLNDSTSVLAVDYYENKEWRNYEIMLQNVTEKNENAFISFVGGASDKFAGPFDIDNIRLYTRVGDVSTGAIETEFTADYHNFDGAAPNIVTINDNATTKGAFLISQYNTRSAASKGAVVTRIYNDTGFTEVPVTTEVKREAATVTENTFVKYNTSNIVLAPGTYRLSGEFRDGYYNKVKDNSMTLTPKLNYNGNITTLGTTQLSNEWTLASYEIKVTEQTKLTDVTFYANEQQTLQFKNVSLQRVITPDDNEKTTNLSSYTASSSDKLNGATVTFGNGNATKVEPVGSANGYITAEPTYASDLAWDSLKIKFSETAKQNRTYYIGFNVRLSVDTPKYDGISNPADTAFRLLANSKSAETGSDYLIGNTNCQAKCTPNGAFYLYALNKTSEWKYVEAAFTPMDKIGENIEIIIRRGVSSERTPMDIDNVVLWYYNDSGERVYCTSLNFDNPNGAYIGAGLDQVNGSRARTHNFDSLYYRVNAASGAKPTVTYTLATPGAAGLYTFKTDIRNTEFLWAAMTTDPNGTIRNLNANTATIEFKLDNNTVITKTASFDCMWTSYSTPIEIPEGRKVTAVTLTTDYTATALDPKAFDIRNTSFVFERPATVKPAKAENTKTATTGYTVTSSDELNGAAVSFPGMTATEVTPKATNGFLRLADRTTSVNGPDYFNIVLDETPVDGRKYYIGFNTRLTVDATADEYFTMRVMLPQFESSIYNSKYTKFTEYCELPNKSIGKEGGTGPEIYVAKIGKTSEWKYFETEFIPKSSNGKSFELSIRRGASGERHPFDIDDFKVWYYDENYNEVVVYSNDFNNENVSPIGTSSDKDKFYVVNTKYMLSHTFETKYVNVMPAVGAAPAIKLEPADNKATEGIYKFTADVRVPFYLWTDYTQNARTLTVKFEMSDGNVSTVSVPVNVMWSRITAPVIVAEDAHIDTVTVTGAYTRTDSYALALDIKNIALVKTNSLEFEETIDDPDNLLNDAAVKYTDGGIEKKTVTDAGNGYMSVAPLKSNGSTVDNSFFNVDVPATPVAGAKYYVSFDYRANAKVINNATNNPRAIWVQVNNGEYAEPTAETFENMPKYVIDANKAPGVSPALNCDWTNFTATFNAPTALKFWVRRGFGDEIAGFDFDNFKIWYVLDGKTVEVCNYDFDDPTKSFTSVFTKGQSKLVHNFDDDYSVMYTTKGSAPYFEYDVSALTLDEGVYTFSIDMMLPDFIYYGTGAENAKKADAYGKRKAVATFVYTDGTTDTTSATTVTADVLTIWDEISMTMVVPRGSTLKSIRIATDVEEFRAVQFKNPSLVKDYEYKQSFGDTEGLANLLTNSNITAADGSGIATVKSNIGNGFVSIPARNYGENRIASVYLTDKIVAGNKYYVSFDARRTVTAKQVHSSNNTLVNSEFVIRAQLGNSVRIEEYNGTLLATTAKTENTLVRDINGAKLKFPNIKDDWAKVEFVATPLATHAGTALTIDIVRGSGNENHPLDIDNLVVYTVDANGTKTVLYENSFDDASVSPFSGSERLAAVSYITPVHAFEADYSTLAPIDNGPASMTYDLTGLEVDGYGEVVLGEGVYTFELDARANAFLFGNGVDNSRTVTATFTFDNGDTNVATAEVTPMWEGETMYCIVPKGRTLVSLKLEMTEKMHNDYMALDYMNVKLTSEAFPVVEAEEDEEEVNYLDGVTMYVDNTAPVEVNSNDTAYLTVGERANGAQNFLTIPLNVAMKKDQTYFISIKMRGTNGVSTYVRPKFEPGNADDVNDPKHLKEATGDTNHPVIKDVGMNADFIVPFDSMIDSNICSWNNVSGSTAKFPNTQLNGKDWITFEGYFTPNQDVPASKSKLVIERGPSSTYVQPIDVDDIVIRTGAGEVVYSNTFKSDIDMLGITAKATVSHVDPIPSYLELAPIDSSKKMTITYNLDLTDDEAVEGKYSFNVSVKTVKATANTPVAKVTFFYDDGTCDSQYLDITSEWNYIGKSDWLGRSPTLETIEIEIDSEVAVQFTHPVLNIQYKYSEGKPNRGIVMVLLKKLQGKMIAPKLREYLPGGDFEQVEPTIHNEAAPKTQDETHEGFWAKMTAANPTTMSVVTEKGNTFVRVTDLDAGQRGIFYNTGVVLQPGKYTFSVDLRVSETEADKNYTAYTWHNNAKDWMYMRTMLQNPANVGSGNYANFDPVDTDTAMNNTGAVTGYQSKVTREWTTYTDTIIIKKPTVMIFKIGGGMSGNADSHGFDIDNVSLFGYVYADGSQAEDVTAVVNLIDNGDFDKAPTVVAGDKYDAGKKGAWFQNNGMDYEYDAKGQPIKTKPLINHDQKITWNDEGYITVSGRKFNMRNVWYNTGINLKPGMYKLSVDFKAANEGEKTYLRFTADNLFSAKPEDAFEVNSTEWTTRTVSFQVTNSTNLKLNFYGGPSTAYIHDFCIDNIVLEKIS